MGNEIIYKNFEVEGNDKYALANSFIRMPNSLSVNALQILGLALSKIDYTKDNGDLITIKTNIAEIKKAVGSNSFNYEAYKKTIEELQNKAFVKIDQGTYYRRANLFPDTEIDEGVISITINNRLNDFIQKLTNNFTVFKVLNLSPFTSRFSIILYWNLCSWNNHSLDRKDALDERERYYTTKQLKEMFDLPIEAYCSKNKNGKLKFNRKLFEKYCLDFAVKEINKYSNIKVEYKKTYNGKKVDKYIFHWFRRDGFNFALGINNK